MFADEVLAIYEGLKWLGSLPYRRVDIESDSLLSVQAIRRTCYNRLEEGHIIDMCCELLASTIGFTLCFIKRQANRVAHVRKMEF